MRDAASLEAVFSLDYSAMCAHNSGKQKSIFEWCLVVLITR